MWKSCPRAFWLCFPLFHKIRDYLVTPHQQVVAAPHGPAVVLAQAAAGGAYPDIPRLAAQKEPRSVTRARARAGRPGAVGRATQFQRRPIGPRPPAPPSLTLDLPICVP